ncbi:hypothetical protein RRG08_003223 [Elysia crispata]|uniref:Calponin-homology (CH) domain-containing protein n=1 Tax=Elysia crispata TaxID=231223 RepID=A0AAE1AZ12_9GAST|nr:hypothetical protein RRG08_003223 [Elysia crispata]
MTQYIFAKRGYNGVTRVDVEDYFDDVELESLYQWIDCVPLSRPKKNIGKDFSDGVLVGEIIKHYFPRLVDLHNYTPAAATKQKMENWFLLNRRVLRRLELDLSDDVIRALANCKQRVVEKVLMMLRIQIDKFIERSNRLRLKTMQLQSALGLKSDMHEPDSDLISASPKPTTITGTEIVPYHQPKAGLKSPRAPSIIGGVPHGHPLRTSYAARPAVLTVAPITDNVSKAMLEEKELECMAKDETIQILNAKLKRMEQLLHLKDIRIEDLESRMNHIQALKLAQFTDNPKMN